MHVWTGEYGYVEPLLLKENTIEELFFIFLKYANLYLSEFVHPMQNETGSLFLQ